MIYTFKNTQQFNRLVGVSFNNKQSPHLMTRKAK